MSIEAKQAPIRIHVRKPKNVKVSVSVKIHTAPKSGQSHLDSDHN